MNFETIKQHWKTLDCGDDLESCIAIDVAHQKLHYLTASNSNISFSISTAKKGVGQRQGSYQTPLGFHLINQKIGENAPLNSIFKARETNGEIAEIDSQSAQNEDCITSRILWLSGLEEGINLSGDVDTKDRYIYIHGTSDEAHIGQAVSLGCIRMNNLDIVQLFGQVDLNTIVYIHE